MVDDDTLSQLRVECNSLEQLGEVAKRIILFSEGLRVWIFEGQMGAGKTTLIKSICSELGVSDTVNSPTYSIVNEYVNYNGQVIYHFDFYRLDHEEEALDIGAEEYFDSGEYCLIEWPSRVAGLLPERFLKIKIDIIDFNRRLIEMTRYE